MIRYLTFLLIFVSSGVYAQKGYMPSDGIFEIVRKAEAKNIFGMHIPKCSYKSGFGTPDDKHNFCSCFFVQDSIDRVKNIIYMTSYITGGDSLLWHFGDGDTSEALTPTHIYKNNGPYLICLIISCGKQHFAWFCDTINDTGLKRFHITASSGFTLIINKSITQIEEISANTLNIFPNPANDKLTIKMPSDWTTGKLMVWDMTGKALIEQNLSGSGYRNIDLSDIVKGNYLLQLTGSGKQFLTHILKQ